MKKAYIGLLTILLISLSVVVYALSSFTDTFISEDYISSLYQTEVIAGQVQLTGTGKAYWWNDDYNYSRRITVDSGDVDADLTNFPVLVYLDNSFEWDKVQDDLDDLRFIDSTNSTEFDYEIENYTLNDNAWIWVNVPSIANASDTDFFVYYGNATVSSGESITDVWDNDYVLVQHLQEGLNETVLDSTQYDNDGTPNPLQKSEIWVSGKLNNSLNFETSDLNIVQVPDTDDSFDTVYTWEMWFQHESGTYKTLVNRRPQTSPYWWIYVRSTTFMTFQGWNGSRNDLDWSNCSHSYDTWQHAVFTSDGQGVTMWWNGVYNGYIELQNMIFPTGENLYIGSYQGTANSLDGRLDELRLYDRIINSTEITSSFNSGNGAEPLNQTGLVLWHRYDESGNNKTASDSSVNNNVGYLVNYYPSSSEDGVINSALEFELDHQATTSGEFVEIPTSQELNITGDLTLSGWIYPETSVTNRYIIKRSHHSVGTQYGYRLMLYSAEYRFWNGATWQASTLANLVTDTLYYFTVVLNSTHVNFYQNGSFLESVASAHCVSEPTESLFLGADMRAGYGYYFLDSFLDEIRISNMTRSSAWIKANFETQRNDLLSYGSEEFGIIFGNNGTFYSENLLANQNATEILSFRYNCNINASIETMTVQFSQDNVTWFDSDGIEDGTDSLTDGDNTINLRGLEWTQSIFFYHINMTGDTVETPELYSITLYYEAEDEMTENLIFVFCLFCMGLGLFGLFVPLVGLLGVGISLFVLLPLPLTTPSYFIALEVGTILLVMILTILGFVRRMR